MEGEKVDREKGGKRPRVISVHRLACTARTATSQGHCTHVTSRWHSVIDQLEVAVNPLTTRSARSSLHCGIVTRSRYPPIVSSDTVAMSRNVTIITAS